MTAPKSKKNPSSSSDAMIWLSGGMFAISCTLLFLFIVHILYHSLQAHWPRRIAVLEKTDGTILAGEIHGYLEDGKTTSPRSLLLKSGYHRTSGQSISTIPMQSLVQDAHIYPEDIVVLELRDAEPVYGLITKVTQLQHSLQTKVAVARVFLSELEFAISRNLVDPTSKNTFEELLPSAIKSLVAKANEPIEIPIEQWNEALANFEQIVARNRESIQQKQLELSSIDKDLALSRKQGIQRAGSRSQAYLKVIDEIFRVAFELGAAEQATYDLEASARFWKDQYQSEDAILLGIDESLDRLKSILKTQQQKLREELNHHIEQNRLSNSIDAIDDTAEVTTLLLEIAQTAKSAYAEQLRVNTELAELDLIRKAFEIELALLDCVSNSADTTPQANEAVEHSGIHSTRFDQSLQYRWVATSAIQAGAFSLANKPVLCSEVVRYYSPNRLGWFGKIGLYIDRWLEFLLESPSRNGLGGGVFPAIWGTIVMTIIMSIMVMPFGVMAAIYMREYAQHSIMLSVVRVTVNNLAGVPSIVYGVFGLAFFSYLIGGFIDGGPRKVGLDPLPILSWSVLSTVTVASILWLAYRTLKPQSKFLRPSFIAANRFFSLMLLIIALVGSFLVVAKVPFFEGFYSDELPNPTFGKGCLLWASFTMALLTLPIVIVTTEEALSSVPASLKEGSYACGATKWQTIRRLVLPYARPGIITGMILSVARGAGEVAPLMLVGVIPLASDLPLDTEYPYLHGSRSFMHLGYHIYSLGLQNPDINSARPMVYATIVLLILIVFVLNSSAIWLRSRINSQMKTQQF
jgi:ABC-type phosphate transport system permease subunit